MNTADFQRGQDQKEGDNATKPFGTVSNAENFVPGHHHKKTGGNSMYWMVSFITIWTDTLTRLTGNPQGVRIQQNSPIHCRDKLSAANQSCTGLQTKSSWKFQADKECREKGNSTEYVISRSWLAAKKCTYLSDDKVCTLHSYCCAWKGSRNQDPMIFTMIAVSDKSIEFLVSRKLWAR